MVVGPKKSMTWRQRQLRKISSSYGLARAPVLARTTRHGNKRFLDMIAAAVGQVSDQDIKLAHFAIPRLVTKMIRMLRGLGYEDKSKSYGSGSLKFVYDVSFYITKLGWDCEWPDLPVVETDAMRAIMEYFVFFYNSVNCSSNESPPFLDGQDTKNNDEIFGKLQDHRNEQQAAGKVVDDGSGADSLRAGDITTKEVTALCDTVRVFMDIMHKLFPGRFDLSNGFGVLHDMLEVYDDNDNLPAEINKMLQLEKVAAVVAGLFGHAEI
jgi:hypothetical protein